MKIDDIKTILVIGAGTMGHQIGFLCAMHGFNVKIYDNTLEGLENAKKRIDALADKCIAKKQLVSDSKKSVIDQIHFFDDLETAASQADLVTESIPEDPKLKAKIFSTLDKICPKHTIFTTNTSTLIPSLIAEATGRPEKFLAFHFHDIVLTRVVDIMPHPGTSNETIEIVKAFAEKLDQIVILLKKENFGYVFNAMLSDLFKSALTLASNGVASVEDIDRAWMGVMNTPIGPFGLMDTIGVDTVWKISDFWANQTKKQQLIANATFLKKYVDEGRCGKKMGKGFYSYPEPLFSQSHFIGSSNKQ